MKYLDEAGLGHLLAKLREIYAARGEAGSGSSWHTGTELRGQQDVAIPQSCDLNIERTVHGMKRQTAEVLLTAKCDLDSVAVSGEYYGVQGYDTYTLTVNGKDIFYSGSGDHEFAQLWSGSLSSGQTIKFRNYRGNNDRVSEREAETRFIVHYNGDAEDFSVATGSTDETAWTVTPTVALSPYAVGDYYLNTEELTLYRCTEAGDTSSSWAYLCALGGGTIDLSAYATREELEGYIPTSERDNFATKSELRGYIPTSERSTFATKSDLNGYIPTSREAEFVTKDELADYIPTSERGSFATQEDLGNYIPTSERGSFATKDDLGDYIPTSERDNFATREELDGYIPTSRESEFATKDELEGYIPTSERGSFATKDELAGYIPSTERRSFATKDDLEGYIPTSERGSFATKAELEDYIPASREGEFATREDLQGYIPSSERDDFVTRDELSRGGSSWHTGTELSGEQSGEIAGGQPGISLVPGNFGDPGNNKTASVTLTARRDLSGVTISGEYHVEEYYDDFSLIVNGSKIINEGHGERSWQRWWTGSLESGQTIQLIYTKDNSTSGKNEDQTRFSISCEGFQADSFELATGATPEESWTWVISATAAYAVGDYYLNTEELTLYRCTSVGGSSSWEYICTLGGGGDLSNYVTREELADYVTREELSQAGSGRTINEAIVTLDSDFFENDGLPHAPKIQSVLLAGQPLSEGVDYAVVAVPSSEPGQHSALAIGIGAYTGAACASWRIRKQTPLLTLSAQSLTIKGVMGTSDSSITISREGSGRISAQSLDPQFATASVVGDRLHLTSVKPGTASILVRVDEDEQYDSADVEFQVQIERADGIISVQPQRLSIEGPKGSSASATISRTGNGAISASSSPYLSSQISASQITLTSISAGSAQLTLSLAQTDDYSAASCTLDVQVSIDTAAPSTTLADNSWDTILEIAARGEAQKYWKVGDVAPKITFTMPAANNSGGASSTTTTLTCDVRILDFDHDDLSESDAKYGDPSYNGGKNKAAISFEMVGTTKDQYEMASTTNDGWGDGSNYIREHLLSKTAQSSFDESGMRTVVKKSSYNDRTSAGRTISTTDDKLFLVALQEVLGTAASDTNDGEGTQYAFYKSGSKRKQDPSGSYASWWTRTIVHADLSIHGQEYKAYMSLGYSANQNTLTPAPFSICFCI